MSNGSSAEDEFCPNWTHQHAVYQLGSFFLLLGLIVPCNVGLPQAIWLRFICVLCFIGYFLWAGVVMCWPDGFAWNLLAVLINLFHVFYMTYITWEVTLSEDSQFVYDTIFSNFNLNKRSFQSLMGNSAGAELYDLDATGKFASEGRSNSSKHLALLIKGRLRVSSGGYFLHYIHPGQFINSPEWNSYDGSPAKYQVTIRAESDCSYVQWPRSKLTKFLKKRRFLRAIMESAIGKDVTNKLYAIGEPQLEPMLFVGVEEEFETGDEKASLLKEDDQLLSHQWERATSIDTEQRPGSFRSAATPKSSGGNFLTVPQGGGEMGSSSSLRRRSLMDIRATMSGSWTDIEKRRSRLSSEEASGVFLTPPQSARGSFRSSSRQSGDPEQQINADVEQQNTDVEPPTFFIESA